MEWHTWFAWYPLRISDYEVIWLENLQRRKSWRNGDWEYKKLDKPQKRVKVKEDQREY